MPIIDRRRDRRAALRMDAYIKRVRRRSLGYESPSALYAAAALQ